MASPFDIFRKHQRGAMATLVLLAMFSFIVLGTIDMGGRFGGGSEQGTAAVVGTWKFGQITQGDIEQRMADRAVVNAFLGGIYQLVQENNVQPQHQEQPFSNDERAVAAGILLSKKAQELGITYSDDAINQFIRSISSNGSDVGLTQTQIRDLIGSLKFHDRRITEGRLFNALRNELAARQVERIFGVSNAIDVAASPAERWEYFRRLNRRINAQVIPIKVADFLDQVPDPTEAQLVAFYEANKERETSPYYAEVGFKQPQRIAFEYLRFDRVKFIDAAREQVKESEIRQRFDANKESYRSMAEREMMTDAATLRHMFGGPATSAAPPDAEKKPDEKKPDEKQPDPQPLDPDAKPEDPKSDKVEKKDTTKDATPEKKAEPPKAESPKTTTPEAKREGGPGGGADGAEDPKSPALNPPTDTAAKPSDTKPKTEPEKKQPTADPKDKPADAKQPDSKQPDSKQPDTKSDDQKDPAKKDDPLKETPLAKPKEPPQAPEPPISDDEAFNHPIVQKDIIDKLAREKAENAIHEQLRARHVKMETFSETTFRQWRRDNPTAPLTSGPKFDLAALADEKLGITFHSTGLVSFSEALHDLDLFKTMVDRQYRQSDGVWMPDPNTGAPFDRVAFGNQLAFVPHRAEELGQFNPNWFLFWRVNEQAGYIPALDDIVKGVKGPDGKTRDIPMREMVQRAWKIANTDGPTSARKLAVARAETIAKDANAEDKPLKEKFGGASDAPEKRVEVLEVGPFSFLERQTMPTEGGFVVKERPRPARLEQIEDAGEEFYKSVLALPHGQAGVAKNYPESIMYVVQVFDTASSTPELLRDEFTRTQYISFNVPHPNYGQQGDSAASSGDYVRLQRNWLAQLEKEYDVDWKRSFGQRDDES